MKKCAGLSVLTSSLAECVAEVMRCIDGNGQASVSVDPDGVVKIRFCMLALKNSSGLKFNYDAFTTPAEIMDDLTQAAASISTYGSDRIDGSMMEIPEVNSSKVDAKESALKTQERNVLECVPMDRPWPIHSVINEMARKFQTRPERSRVASILDRLVEIGLLRKNSAHEFQRPRKPDAEDQEMKPAISVAKKNDDPQAQADHSAQAVTIMDRIAEVSSELRRESANFATAFAKMAVKLDEIGMDAGQQTQISASEAAKFRQFRELFKSLGA